MVGVEALSSEQLYRAINHFRTLHEKIVWEWLDHALIKKEDPFYEEVVKNGNRTLDLLYQYIEKPDIALIMDLTKKIAPERIEAKTDISEFVYNINIGRQIVNDKALNSIFLPEEKKWIIMTINHFFDQLLYYAIKEFSSLNDVIIENKNQFIQEMHSDRLTILGQIAASFAHEFRNPLTSIKGFIYLLESELVPNEKTDHYISIINDEMENLQDKISQFLLLSKMKGLDDLIAIFDLSICLHEMIDFMYPRFLEAKINLMVEISPDLKVEGDKNQLKQVILNILNNAVEELCDLPEERIIKVKAYRSSEKIRLEISNNGSQIPAHLLENIFEPFITTKELGTGLGLSVCKQIVEKHNGQILVDSNASYTTFSISIPEAIERTSL
ncbi:histidine kinase N-terminal domain-containing protein [Fictibacillus sp. B-59209]|uniref:histidine kinase N-terminal domain-containing protein n=1 Tax=Fictibacillus sp. B-59209 TaxID=3024873 RepID=UPI0006A79D7A|nr:histidine kinase N-terminal domain-containing protein [Fictibacillus sp. B-59209]MED2973605.1 histidine kinase N-terminal domain-containing protein [Fictibacillus sp. B-59209]